MQLLETTVLSCGLVVLVASYLGQTGHQQCDLLLQVSAGTPLPICPVSPVPLVRTQQHMQPKQARDVAS